MTGFLETQSQIAGNGATQSKELIWPILVCLIDVFKTIDFVTGFLETQSHFYIPANFLESIGFSQIYHDICDGVSGNPITNPWIYLSGASQIHHQQNDGF